MDPVADLRAATLALVVAIRAGTLHDTWTKIAKPLLMVLLKGCYSKNGHRSVLPIAGQAVKAKPV